MSYTSNINLFKHDNPSTNTNNFDVGQAINENLDKIDNFAGQTNKLKTITTDIILTDEYEYLPSTELSITRGKYLNYNGTVSDTTLQNFMVTNFIDVEKFYKIKVTLTGGGSVYPVCFYDGNYNFISNMLYTSAITNYSNEIVTVPENAKYCRLSSYNSKDLIVYYQENIKNYINDVNEKVNRLNILDGFYKLSDEELDVSAGCIDAAGNIYSLSNLTLTNYIEVFKYQKVRISLHYGNSVCGCVFFDKNKNYLGYCNSLNGSGENILAENVEIELPEYCKYIRCSSWGAPSSKPIKVEFQNTPEPLIKSLDNRVEILESIGNPLHEKNITVIGDSITEYNFRAGTNWSMWIKQWCECNIQNLGVSGTGFVRSSPYINRINQINNNVDIIGIACSFNDLDTNLPLGTTNDTGTSSICGYINDFFAELISEFPSTPIIVYCQGPWSGLKFGVTSSDNYINAVRTICEKNGMPFYEELYTKGSVLKPWIADNRQVYYKSDNQNLGNTGVVDSVHPNSLGHKAIAKYLKPIFEQNII